LQVNEATKLIEEGVCSDPREIDLAMANGGGSPFGPFALAKGIGYDVLNAKLEEIYNTFKAGDLQTDEAHERGEDRGLTG